MRDGDIDRWSRQRFYCIGMLEIMMKSMGVAGVV